MLSRYYLIEKRGVIMTIIIGKKFNYVFLAIIFLTVKNNPEFNSFRFRQYNNFPEEIHIDFSKGDICVIDSQCVELELKIDLTMNSRILAPYGVCVSGIEQELIANFSNEIDITKKYLDSLFLSGVFVAPVNGYTTSMINVESIRGTIFFIKCYEGTYGAILVMKSNPGMAIYEVWYYFAYQSNGNRNFMEKNNIINLNRNISSHYIFKLKNSNNNIELIWKPIKSYVILSLFDPSGRIINVDRVSGNIGKYELFNNGNIPNSGIYYLKTNLTESVLPFYIIK